MTLFFHSDDVDEFLSLTEAVKVAEEALRNIPGRQGVNAPRKRRHRQFAEASFDAVLNVYAGGSASYGAIGAQVALQRKTIEGNVQKTRPIIPSRPSWRRCTTSTPARCLRSWRTGRAM